MRGKFRVQDPSFCIASCLQAEAPRNVGEPFADQSYHLSLDMPCAQGKFIYDPITLLDYDLSFFFRNSDYPAGEVRCCELRSSLYKCMYPLGREPHNRWKALRHNIWLLIKFVSREQILVLQDGTRKYIYPLHELVLICSCSASHSR